MPEYSDEMRLIEQVCAGKRESFRALVESHQQQIFRICFHLLKDTANAEDLAQDTFVTAFRKIGQFDPDRGKFSTWLITIAKRLCLNVLRKTAPISMAEPPEVSAPIQNSPDHRAARSDTFRALDQALAELSDEHRRAFVFAEIEELPYEEIARIEDIAPGTVKSRVNRAKLALQGLLRTTYEELT
jgi:RNA polymerase sigma-70 factor (ECF subfamily)